MDGIKIKILFLKLSILLALMACVPSTTQSAEIVRQKWDTKSLAVGAVVGGSCVAVMGYCWWKSQKALDLGLPFQNEREAVLPNNVLENQAYINYFETENKRLQIRLKEQQLLNSTLVNEAANWERQASRQSVQKLTQERDQAEERAKEAEKELASAEQDAQAFRLLYEKLAQSKNGQQ